MINNIKIGIKISTKDIGLISEINANQAIINFIEIILKPNFELKDINFIENLKLPYAIHLPHSNYGIDFGDKTRNNENLEFIDRINQYKKDFNRLRPICYIVHPESESIELSITNIKKLKLKPIAIENMPKLGNNGKNLLGYNPTSLKLYFKNLKNLKFCFDINHAIKAAISMKKDYLTFIEEFLEFKKPILFHLSGGNLNIEIDEHLPLNMSQYNLFEIKRILRNYTYNVNLTFETPRNNEKQIYDDLKNIECFLNAEN